MTEAVEMAGRARLETLSEAECWGLLQAGRVGRLAVLADGWPAIFPVNYVLDGDLVVLRTDPGSKLTNATLDRVAFEVDEFDADAEAGWSVLIQGLGVEVTEGLDEASERERELDLVPWAPGDKSHWVRIIKPRISGRRIVRDP